MKHIELVLTDTDIEVTQHILAAQRDTMSEMIADGRISGEQVREARLLVSTFESLWWKFHYALNPKAGAK